MRKIGNYVDDLVQPLGRKRRSQSPDSLRAQSSQGLFHSPVSLSPPSNGNFGLGDRLGQLKRPRAAPALGPAPLGAAFPKPAPKPAPQLGAQPAAPRAIAVDSGLAKNRSANSPEAGFRRHGPFGTVQPVGQPRAIDAPAFPVDNRQLVTPRSAEQVITDRQAGRDRMWRMFEGKPFPGGDPAAFGNRDRGAEDEPVLGRTRADLIRARGEHDETFDAEKFLAKDVDRLAEIQGRRDLRKRRGIERGEARHESQVAMLRAQGQPRLDPGLVVAMRRDPGLLVDFLKLQQQGAIEAKRLGLAGEELELDATNAKEDRLLNLSRWDKDRQLEARGLDLQREKFQGDQTLGQDRLRHQIDIDGRRVDVLGRQVDQRDVQAEADRAFDRERLEQDKRQAELRYSPGARIDPAKRLEAIFEEGRLLKLDNPTWTRERALEEAERRIDRHLGIGTAPAATAP